MNAILDYYSRASARTIIHPPRPFISLNHQNNRPPTDSLVPILASTNPPPLSSLPRFLPHQTHFKPNRKKQTTKCSPPSNHPPPSPSLKSSPFAAATAQTQTPTPTATATPNQKARNLKRRLPRVPRLQCRHRFARLVLRWRGGGKCIIRDK